MGQHSLHSASVFCSALLLTGTAAIASPPNSAALMAFSAYSQSVEVRLVQQHKSADTFLPAVRNPETANRLRQGELIVEQLSPKSQPPGALLHHWRGTAFAHGATAVDFEHLMREFKSYPKYFAPEVLSAGVLSQDGNRMQTRMRVRQHHVITVVMDTSYDVTFGQLDLHHGYSISRSTRMAEVDSPGTPEERQLGPAEEHGFLWRLDTYWSYEERDGGLYMQVETVSLTRTIPQGLGWVAGPYIKSIPRESLEFTLRSACRAIGK